MTLEPLTTQFQKRIVALAICEDCGSEVTEIDFFSLICEPCFNKRKGVLTNDD